MHKCRLRACRFAGGLELRSERERSPIAICHPVSLPTLDAYLLCRNGFLACFPLRVVLCATFSSLLSMGHARLVHARHTSLSQPSPSLTLGCHGSGKPAVRRYHGALRLSFPETGTDGRTEATVAYRSLAAYTCAALSNHYAGTHRLYRLLQRPACARYRWAGLATSFAFLFKALPLAAPCPLEPFSAGFRAAACRRVPSAFTLRTSASVGRALRKPLSSAPGVARSGASSSCTCILSIPTSQRLVNYRVV